MDSSFRENVGVEAVAEVDRVDIVAFEVRVHYREENLKEKVHRIEQDRKEIQPGFARHVEKLLEMWW